jgi:peptidoglycan/xylan/chitin deacetylase (PgdA/CDA1 family)
MIRRFSFLAFWALLPLAGLAEPPAPAPAPAAPAATTVSAPATAGAPAKITYTQCHVDGPYIAMTFDDGPHAQNTPRLLDMLKERGIHATFFLVGQNAAEYPQIVKRIVAEGHDIANHSWSHPQLSRMTDEGVRQEIEKTQAAILAGSGVTPKLMRPPYGAFTERQRRWANGEFGFKIILWDVDPLDWKVRNAAHVQSEILRQTQAGSIILSHDIHKTTVDAMPATLDALAAKGFKFVTVSQLIAMDRPVKPKAAEPAKGSPVAKADKPESKSNAKSDTKTEPKSDAKTEPKPEPKATPAAAPAPAAASAPAGVPPVRE